MTRTGGTGGQWTVPVTLSGDLSASPSTTITNGGTFNPSNLTLVFPAGGASQTIQYQPAATMPAGTNLTMTLGTPVGPVPASAQTASLGTITSHSVTLSGPAVGCPAPPATPKSLGGAGTVNHNNVTSGTITVYNLPTASTGVGQVNLYSNPSTPKFGPTTTEISISKCQGDFSNNADGCYQAVDALDGTQINQEWALNYNARYPNAAAFVRQKRCLTPAGSSYYVNIRVTFPPGACGSNTCGWDPIWRALSTFL
ncbi:MAG TPA: hypothetical protein VFU92_09345 [Usitatibacter sp.]|nr:hypothetical protein [Usitatibacter sp.]